MLPPPLQYSRILNLWSSPPGPPNDRTMSLKHNNNKTDDLQVDARVPVHTYRSLRLLCRISRELTVYLNPVRAMSELVTVELRRGSPPESQLILDIRHLLLLP